MNFSKNHWGKSLFYFLFSFSIILSSCKKDQEHEPKPVEQPQPNPAPQDPGDCVTKAASDNGKIIPEQYIVRYKSGAEDMSVNSSEVPAAILSRINLPQVKARHLYAGKFRAFAAQLSAEQAENLKKDPEVESVEPDRIASIVSCYTTINDQSTPWGVKRVGQGDGTGKYVWIIDTGVDMDHPDLNVDANRCKSFIAGKTAEDDHGHGTHVAGTIAAKNNLTGVVGVAANAKIVALKVMDENGKGSISNIVAAVNYVAQYGKPGDVVNMSIGGGLSETLDNAVKDAADKGIFFAIAAGNSSQDAINSSPGRVSHQNVFTISAMNDQDTFASFSNYGISVDFCAPGVNVNSTHLNGGYATMSGTSMATPHVSGLLLLKGRNILTDGFVKNDPDGQADPIAHK